jgi:hypothetical protein
MLGCGEDAGFHPMNEHAPMEAPVPHGRFVTYRQRDLSTFEHFVDYHVRASAVHVAAINQKAMPAPLNGGPTNTCTSNDASYAPHTRRRLPKFWVWQPSGPSFL